ncbi:TRAP transporter small permease [Paracoccus sp. (in: a-proteobacteria)]|uniref:TRAP transporter small permease n=1 Tax=Paracoccus sp. TaxID=267 RepID=UPI003A8BABC6
MIRTIRTSIGALCALLLLVLAVLVLYQSSSRYLTFLPSLLWTEEIARGLLVWVVMLGAGWAAFEGTHFRLAVLENRLGRLYDCIGLLGTLIAGGYLVWSAIPFSQRGMTRVSQVSGLPAVWVYLALFVGGVLILLGAAFRIYLLAATRKTGG